MIQAITLGTAIVGAICGVTGAVLGVISTWHQVQRNKVRLKVTPHHVIPAPIVFPAKAGIQRPGGCAPWNDWLPTPTVIPAPVVIPAKAGNQRDAGLAAVMHWIPAFAGMTVGGAGMTVGLNGAYRERVAQSAKLEKHRTQFKAVFDALRELMTSTAPPPRRQIGFRKDEGE